jgi:hypothetical protein
MLRPSLSRYLYIVVCLSEYAKPMSERVVYLWHNRARHFTDMCICIVSSAHGENLWVHPERPLLPSRREVHIAVYFGNNHRLTGLIFPTKGDVTIYVRTVTLKSPLDIPTASISSAVLDWLNLFSAKERNKDWQRIIMNWKMSQPTKLVHYGLEHNYRQKTCL